MDSASHHHGWKLCKFGDKNNFKIYLNSVKQYVYQQNLMFLLCLQGALVIQPDQMQVS